MSTQFITGETTQQYWADIAAGPAQNPLRNNSYVSATSAYVARNKALAGALTTPGDIDVDADTPAMPSVGINAADNENTTYTKNPQRYVL